MRSFREQCFSCSYSSLLEVMGKLRPDRRNERGCSASRGRIWEGSAVGEPLAPDAALGANLQPSPTGGGSRNRSDTHTAAFACADRCPCQEPVRAQVARGTLALSGQSGCMTASEARAQGTLASFARNRHAWSEMSGADARCADPLALSPGPVHPALLRILTFILVPPELETQVMGRAIR